MSTATAVALMPLAKPGPYSGFDPGSSSPFQGSWSVSIPTMEVGVPDQMLARCNRPVRIQPADASHILYLGPRDKQSDPAMELQELHGGALWVPTAGGPSFYSFWVSHDLFYLYDEVPQNDSQWGWPYVYRRCDAGDY